MAAFNKFNCLAWDVARCIHNFTTHAFKVRLSNAAPSATMDKIACITTIATGNGWATDIALAIANATVTADGSTMLLTFDDATVEAAGGAIAEFRYAALYNSNDATGHLIGWWDYGTVVNLGAGEKLVIDFDGTAVIKVATT